MELSLTVPLQKLRTWYTRKNPIELWLDLLRHAETFEDWEEADVKLLVQLMGRFAQGLESATLAEGE